MTLSLLSACASDVERRIGAAEKKLEEAHYTSAILDTGHYRLFAAIPQNMPPRAALMTIVIEGDGYAWINRYTQSVDPTPRQQTGLRLALGPFTGSVYLGRPCQYIHDPKCAPSLWGRNRFSPEVMDTYNAALSTLKVQYGVSGFRLVGYSGGGYIALYLAATRRDVISVTGVADLMDPALWTQHHGISPLYARDRFADLAVRAGHTPFTHWCGLDDDTMPCSLQQKALGTLRPDIRMNHQLIDVPDATHDTIWRAVTP